MKKLFLFCSISLGLFSALSFSYAQEPVCTFNDDSILKIKAGIVRVVCVKDAVAKFYLNDQDLGIVGYINTINLAIQNGEINIYSQVRADTPTTSTPKTAPTTPSGDCSTMPDTIKTFKFKQESPEIKQAQDILYTQKYLTNPPNGYFGAGTLSGIKKFQKDMKLRVTAVLDAATWKKLKDVCLASPAQ